MLNINQNLTLTSKCKSLHFDVSQTEGDPLPDLGIQELTADVENYEFFMRAMEQVSPVPIRFNEISGEAKGYYDNGSKEIVIQQGMSESQTLKTAIHETAHAMFHDRDAMKKKGIQKDKMTVECEAESIAFTVCQHFGIDTSDYSFPYIASWSSTKDMKELRSSMDTIRHTAAEMIDGITETVRDMQREQQRQSMETEKYQEVEILGVPALFSNGRIADDAIPEGFYRHDLRGSDYDPGRPITVENSVFVNHAATILTMYPLNLPERGFLYLGDELNFTGAVVSMQEYRQQMADLDTSFLAEAREDAVIRANENLLWGDPKERYAIYQISSSGPGEAYRFMNMDFVNRQGMAVKGSDYKLVYAGELEAGDTPETLYVKFNKDRPQNFTGHSLSVSDVIFISHGNEAGAHYVDSVGFQDLPDFIQQRRTLWEQQWMQVTEFTDSIKLDGHDGTWHTAGLIELMGETIYLMENNEYGSDVAKLAVNAKGDVVAEDLWEGGDEEFHKAAAEYFAGKGVVYERTEAVPEEKQEVTETVETNQTKHMGQKQKRPVAHKTKDVKQEYVASHVAEAVEATGTAAASVSKSEKIVQDTVIPVYMQTPAYAREHGELEQYRQSRNENIACKKAIEKAVYDNFDGMHLNADAVKPVLEQFGKERVAYVLASTIQMKNWDKRFALSNREWAASIPIGEEISPFGNDRRIEWMVESHPAVLDGFVGMLREEVLEQERGNEKTVDKEKPKEKELTADEVTNFEEISREYYPHLRTAEVVFSCEVRGEPDMLTYELSQHDDGESYSLHTKNHDIWDRMSRKELGKLESVVSREATFSGWKKEIEQADSADALREVEFGMMETEHLNLSDAQRERLYQMMEEKGKAFQQGQTIDRGTSMQGKDEKSVITQNPTEAEQTATISFYVAECMEYPVLGEYHENIASLQEAMALYEQIPAERMNGIKGIGFTLSDGSMYDGMSYELMSVGIVDRDLVEEIPYYKENPLVQKALAELEAVYGSPHSTEQGKKMKGIAAAESQVESQKRPQEDKTVEQGTDDIGGPAVAVSESHKGAVVAAAFDSNKGVGVAADSDSDKGVGVAADSDSDKGVAVTAAPGSRKKSVL